MQTGSAGLLTPTGLKSVSRVKYLLRVSGIFCSTSSGAAFIGMSRSGSRYLATLEISLPGNGLTEIQLMLTYSPSPDTCASDSSNLYRLQCGRAFRQGNTEILADHSTGAINIKLFPSCVTGDPPPAWVCTSPPCRTSCSRWRSPATACRQSVGPAGQILQVLIGFCCLI